MGMEDVLRQIRQTLSRDYIASTIVGLDGISLAFDSMSDGLDSDRLAAELTDGIKDIARVVNETHSGNLHYINIATEKYKILLTPLDFGKSGSGYFCALIIKQDGNVGKAILEMEKARKALMENHN